MNNVRLDNHDSTILYIMRIKLFAFKSQIDARSGTQGLNVSSIGIAALSYI